MRLAAWKGFCGGHERMVALLPSSIPGMVNIVLLICLPAAPGLPRLDNTCRLGGDLITSDGGHREDILPTKCRRANVANQSDTLTGGKSDAFRVSLVQGRRSCGRAALFSDYPSKELSYIPYPKTKSTQMLLVMHCNIEDHQREKE